MTKQSGIGSYLFVGSADISGDVGAVSQMEAMRAALEQPSITDAAMDRIMARRDGALAFASFWNTAAGQAHATLSALPRTDQMVSVYLGSTVGAVAASMLGKQLNYPLAWGQDGSLGAAVSAQANGYGLEFGEMLTTGKQTFATGTVNGTSIDLGAVSTLFGSAAYLQVFSVGSGTSTFSITDSSDNVTFGTTLHTFTPVTGAATERLQGSLTGTVRRYVRLEKTGVSTATVAAVNFVRYTETGPA